MSERPLQEYELPNAKPAHFCATFFRHRAVFASRDKNKTMLEIRIDF